jgi:hypothetical protein
MAQRRKDEGRKPSPSSSERPASERRSRQPKRPGAGEPERQRGNQRDTGRSWVHDEPPLEQHDDPRHSGYSDRETPEAGTPESQPGRSGERPRTTR